MLKNLSEATFVDQFTALLSSDFSPFKCKSLAIEFLYPSGKVDVVGTLQNGQIIAFEAKLNKWRNALDQAFRATSFCHHAYVVLPKKVALLASAHQSEFERRGVGIVYIDNDRLVLALKAVKHLPILPWLTRDVSAYIKSHAAFDATIAECR